MLTRILAASMILFASTTAFAVNVTVRSQNGDVSIVGDDLPDSLVIESLFDGVLIVRGRNTGPFDLWPTLINGSTKPLVIEVQDDLYIDLGDGGNELEIYDLYLYRSSYSDITVTLGRDADTFFASNIVTSGNFKVNMGSGRDTAEAFDIIARGHRYLQGSGTGVFNLGYHHSARIEVSTGSSTDIVHLGELRTTVLDVHLGSGDDTAHLYDGVEGNQRSVLDGGDGYDRHTLRFGLLPRYLGYIRSFESTDTGNLFFSY